MPIDAIVTFETLSCSREDDASGHSEPYLWPMVIKVDDNTLATDQDLIALSPTDQSARVVVKDGMKRGDSAPVPASQRTFAFRFEDNQTIHAVLIVVALLEEDELPLGAVTKGYQAFRRELPKAIAARLGPLFIAEEQGDDAGTAILIKQIRDTVEPAVKSGIRSGLSAGQKARILIGTLNPDDQVGFANKSFKDLLDSNNAPVNQTFRMLFVTRDGNNKVTDLYVLQGRFQTKVVVPDKCQALVDKVKAAQQTVQDILAQIRDLQEQLRNAAPGEKPFLVAEIRRVRTQELAPAEKALEAARQALAACRKGPVFFQGLEAEAITEQETSAADL